MAKEKFALFVRLAFFLPVTLSVLILCCNKKESNINPIVPKTPVEQKSEMPAEKAHEMTPEDVAAFLDGLVPLLIERSDIAGTTIAVVKDGKVIFEKGYGYADIAKKKPVSATDTLFRPGSISKLFTWTAVMQQVEQGKLNLDHDVNEYLDFKIPSTYPQPITLRNIMTHTPGYGEVIKDLFIPEGKDLTPLGGFLATHMPNRIYLPGTVPAYSNYATSMAGYIVQRVSGKDFNQYINENILQPLNMKHSTFSQPLPKELEPLMSRGYKLASLDPGPFEIVEAWPAGSLSASAEDMTHFIIAHLQNGEYNGARILREDTAKLMHSRQFGAHPATNAMALGFYEETRNGHRIIGHAGDTYYFHSDLHLIPDANVGFFVSFNSGGKGEDSERTALWDKFLNRYFPYTPPPGSNVASAAQDAQTVSGLYMSSRRSQGNFMQAFNAIGQTKVYTNSDGTISVSDIKDFASQPKKMREISPLVYRDVNGQEKVAFNRDANGRLYFAMDWPFMIFQRVTFFQSKTFTYVVLIGSLSIMLLTLILWPVAGLVRRHYASKLNLGIKDKRLRLAVRLICAINLIFVIAFVAFISSLEAPGAINHNLDPWIHLLQIVGWIGALGTIVVVYSTIQTWRAATAPRWVKLFQALTALACIGLSWFLLYWNVLNLTSNY